MGIEMKHRSYRIKSVEKAIRLLMLFTVKSPSLTLNQLSEGLGVHRSTAYRIAMTLVEEGFLRWSAERGTYSLGLKILELSSVLINSLELRFHARPHLERLRHDTGETVHLAVLEQGEVVYIDKLDAARGIQLYSGVGKKTPCHCTALGKVLLAGLPESKVRSILEDKGMKSFTPNTLVSVRSFLAHLERVRRDDFALDLEEHEQLIYCVAVPIRDHSRKTIAALSITLIFKEFSEEMMDRYITAAREAGARISTEMGYITPRNMGDNLPGSIFESSDAPRDTRGPPTR